MVLFLGCSSGSFTVGSPIEDTGVRRDTLSEVDDTTGSGDAPACNPDEVPNDKLGVFVSPAGNDAQNGSADRPLAKIGAALTAARTRGLGRVYLDVGVYPESLAIIDSPTGVWIEGGWKKTGAGWRRNCSAAATADTVIRASTAVAVTASNNGHLSGLRTLSVETKEAGAAGKTDADGESTIGVLIHDVPTLFGMEDVNVTAGSGGAAGAAGPSGVKPLPPSCDGLTDCTLDGANGKAASDGAPAPRGAFSATGYNPGVAEPGGSGETGRNGTSGDKGGTLSCVDKCGSGCVSSCPAGSGSSKTASPGTCGCGGAAGVGGSRGRNGGASVAVLVVGGRLSVTRGTVKSARGGDGSKGGDGSPGDGGTAGSTGSSVGCDTGCVKSATFCVVGMECTPGKYNTAKGGGAGGKGGTGGTGGAGGGGAGGPSHAIVLAGGASLEGTPVLLVDSGGRGGGSAPDGASLETLVQP